jgi:5-formyltetrahydrofolate cyclo-ligase
MIAVRLHNLHDVVHGVLNIRVPKEPYEIIDPKDIDFVLVPGAGFDRLGGRMGMGNGYYDRFLKGLSPSNYIGVAWKAQIMKNPIPMERYDQRMPAIVTEQGVIHVI